jgi:hypothetical protein
MICGTKVKGPGENPPTSSHPSNPPALPIVYIVPPGTKPVINPLRFGFQAADPPPPSNPLPAIDLALLASQDPIRPSNAHGKKVSCTHETDNEDDSDGESDTSKTESDDNDTSHGDDIGGDNNANCTQQHPLTDADMRRQFGSFFFFSGLMILVTSPG